jgi:rhodanese-related sulfurtransferase
MTQPIAQISAADLSNWLGSPDKSQPLLLDVRENWEFETCKLPGSLSIPMGNIMDQAKTLNPDAAVVCICHHGIRSQQVALYLKSIGFSRLYNLQGGIHAWSCTVDPSCPTY